MTGNNPTFSTIQNLQNRPVRLLTRFEARERLGGLSDDKFYSLIRAGELPPPIKLGTSSRWLETDVDGFILKLAESRKAHSPPAGIRRHHEKLARQRIATGAA
jgi:predicted DNA-binding transcriptional regulator AlpA